MKKKFVLQGRILEEGRVREITNPSQTYFTKHKGIMKQKSTLRSFLLAAGSSLLAISSASAQSWDGSSSGDWLTGTNWGGDVAAGSTTSTDTDIAVFNVNANNTIGINMTTAVGNYYLGAIDNTNATARVINNTSGTTGVLRLNGATVNSVANTIIRNSTSTLLTIGNSGSGTLGLALGNATANVIQITSSGGITINSIISGGNGITKQGSGTGVLTLAGNNSYTGVTAINVGVISISNNNALGSTGVGNGTTLAATGSLTTGGQLQLSGGITSAENITITGATETSGYNGAIRNVSGNNTLSGNITLSSLTNGVRLDTAGGNLIFSGNISQTGSSQGFSLAPTSSSTITVNNAIANNGGVFQTLSSGVGGVGTTILKGVNATDGTGIGATNVAQNSTLQLGVTNALNTTANLNIAAFGGTDQGTFNLNGFDQTVNALTSSATGANRIVRNNSATTASILTVGNGGGTGAFNGTIVNGAAATLALVKTGAGNQTLSGINTYTGGTRIDNGTLTLGHATDTITGAVNVNGGTLALGTNTDTVGAVTLTSGSITGSGAGKLTGTGSAFDVRSGTISAKLGGTVGLTKTTTGTVTISSDNSSGGYTGATNVNDGKLIVDGNISTSSLTTVAIGATLGGSGTVGATTINGILAPGNSIGTLNATGDVTWNDNDAWVFELGSAASTLELANTTSGLSDLLNITGAGNDFIKGSGSSFTFDFVGGGTIGWYKLVDWDSTTTFGFTDFVATNLGSGFTGSFTVDSGTSALYLNVVPEPNVAALLGGLGALMLLRRRR